MPEVLDIGYGRPYKLTEEDANAINRRRRDVRRSQIATKKWGVQVHMGSEVAAEEVYPLYVTRVVGEDDDGNTIVNGKVFLDGNDDLWVRAVYFGDEPGNYLIPV